MVVHIRSSRLMDLFVGHGYLVTLGMPGCCLVEISSMMDLLVFISMYLVLSTNLAFFTFSCRSRKSSSCRSFAVTSGSSFVGRHSMVSVPQSTSSLQMVSHGKRFNKLGKPADQRKALLRALTTEVIRHGRIKTTLVRARAVRKHVDHMIQLGKRGDLHARRQALGWIYDKDLVHSLFEAAPDRYSDREGGYTRVLRTVARQGDNAKMAIIELV
jgi:large subunit ribosomal protein L17